MTARDLRRVVFPRFFLLLEFASISPSSLLCFCMFRLVAALDVLRLGLELLCHYCQVTNHYLGCSLPVGESELPVLPGAFSSGSMTAIQERRPRFKLHITRIDRSVFGSCAP